MLKVLTYVITRPFYKHPTYRMLSPKLKNIRRSSTQQYQINLQIGDVSLNNYLLRLEQEYKDNSVSGERCRELQLVMHILEDRKKVVENLDTLTELLKSDDEDMRKMALEEKEQFESKIKQYDYNLLEALLPAEEEDSCDSLVIEIQAGVGGQEAMLFAKEMFNMYCKFAEYKGWESEIAEYLDTDIGGLRHASLLISGPLAYRFFKHEGGIHRVQRIPATEKSGRIHTSTVSIAILPQPTDINVDIQQTDLKIETKRSQGAGGQHVNTTDSAVRVIHLPTGIAVECQTDRSQIKNRKLALTRLKAILYQKELNNQMAQIDASRRNQVKTRNRNEKIRTYNFNQDRITDHRLQGAHIHNLQQFFEGGQHLEKLISQLDRQSKVENLLAIVNKN